MSFGVRIGYGGNQLTLADLQVLDPYYEVITHACRPNRVEIFNCWSTVVQSNSDRRDITLSWAWSAKQHARDAAMLRALLMCVCDAHHTRTSAKTGCRLANAA